MAFRKFHSSNDAGSVRKGPDRPFMNGILQSKGSMMEELKTRYDKCTGWLNRIERAGNSLPALFEIHKNMWKDGVRHENFGPDEYGMFRTKDIENMTMDEVYLGNVDGLWTFTLSQWKKDKNDEMNRCRVRGDMAIVPSDYLRICRQYREHLFVNVKYLRSRIFEGTGLDEKKNAPDNLTRQQAKACVENVRRMEKKGCRFGV